MALAWFITAQRAQHGVPHAVACRALGVSQAWYYKWRQGDMSVRRRRRAAVDAAVAYEFARRNGRDGSPPITLRLKDSGWRISKNTVADSMCRQGLVARPRKHRRGLTKADKRVRKPPDLLRRDVVPPVGINQRWTSDLTEIPTGEGVLYLASILDLHGRRVVGYALGARHDADLAAAAVQVAIAIRGGDVAGVVLHTDQGGEFCGGNLTRVCGAAGIVQSMGRTGSALDNAVVESYHSTLEFELLSRTRFATRAQARQAVIVWIEEYNTERLHSAKGMITPVGYEHGRRRPGAKPYDQLRRPEDLPSRCAMLTGAAQRTGPSLRPQGPRPLTRRPYGASLTPEPLRARQATPTAGQGLPPRSRGATRPRS